MVIRGNQWSSLVIRGHVISGHQWSSVVMTHLPLVTSKHVMTERLGGIADHVEDGRRREHRRLERLVAQAFHRRRVHPPVGKPGGVERRDEHSHAALHANCSPFQIGPAALHANGPFRSIERLPARRRRGAAIAVGRAQHAAPFPHRAFGAEPPTAGAPPEATALRALLDLMREAIRCNQGGNQVQSGRPSGAIRDAIRCN